MFCVKCGTKLSDGSKFCVMCGAPVETVVNEAPTIEETPVEEAPVEEVPVPDPERESLKAKAASDALRWGILSLVFGLEGFLVSFLGIIFATKGFKKADWFAYLNNGVLSGKAKIGRILSKVGLILSIVMTVVWVLYVLYFIFLIVVMEGGSPSVDFYY